MKLASEIFGAICIFLIFVLLNFLTGCSNSAEWVPVDPYAGLYQPVAFPSYNTGYFR